MSELYVVYRHAYTIHPPGDTYVSFGIDPLLSKKDFGNNSPESNKTDLKLFSEHGKAKEFRDKQTNGQLFLDVIPFLAKTNDPCLIKKGNRWLKNHPNVNGFARDVIHWLGTERMW